MKIYLVRHGDAVPEEAAGSDRDRWLSRRGRDAVRVLARLLREQGLALDSIVCSPLPRAVQTAELLADGLSYLGAIESLRCLEPAAAPPLAGQAVITRGAGGSSVLVVGHEPSLSSLGAHLLGRPSFPPFRTAQACAIEDRRPTFTARADIAQVQAYFVD
ncbi:MAG: phosphohistidine phosphatase SixA [Myxococcales bacterium]|nr:phosphohistidine phosphatase SixA [Myxococcales bacterium]